MGKCICGNDKCKGVCNKSIANRIAHYIRDVETVESRLGEVNTSKGRNGSVESVMIITGVELHEKGNRTDIMNISKDGLKMYDMFNKIDDKSIKKFLEEYIDESEYTDKNKIIQKANNIAKNKEIIVPIKPGSSCNIRGKQPNETIEAKIDGIKVSMNSWTDEIEYDIITEKLKDGDTKRHRVLDTKEYGRDFKVSSMYSGKLVSDASNNPIHIITNGCIRPVQITNGKETVVIDRSAVYKINISEEDEVIGFWRDDIVTYIKNIESEAIKSEINKFTKQARELKGYITPYKLIDTHKIKVSDKKEKVGE